MAVETNKGATPPNPNPGATLTGVPSAAGTGPAQTLTGMAAATAAAKGKPRKRSSSLMQIQSSLPSVESSLDEFIARANQTLTDPAQWQAEAVKQQEADEQRREQDALRWKAAEQQLREGDAREQSLRRQLDGLQGRLAEAEARAAVASTTGTSQDGVVADLKIRLQKMEEKLRTADGQAHQAQRRAEELMIELTSAKAQAAAAPAVRDSLPRLNEDNDELFERVRIAEAKAQKAIAAARAASAGLTVNPADIAAIESGLVVPSFEQPKGTNWGLVIGALVVGAAVMFGVTKFVLKTDAPAATAQPATAAAVQPAAAPAAAPQKPIVTPIEDDKPAAPADQAAAAPAAPANAAAPADDSAAKLAAEKAAAEKAAADQAAADVAAKKALAEKAAAEQTPAHPAKAPAHAPAHHAAAAKSAPGGGLADPFGGEAPAPKKAAPKKADKKAGGIVDPF